MTEGPTALASSAEPLHHVHDLAMLDLDGVVYLGPDPIDGAAEALAAARGAGMRLAYLTNNASRMASTVAAHLREIGMPDLDDSDVVTSAQAVARLMADDLPTGSPVLVVGGEGLRRPLQEAGLRCVDSMDDDPVAVVQGFDPSLGWKNLAEAAYAVGSGLPWYASNTDMTVPTARGIAPGNGSLVQAVANATGRTPVVAGKPERPLFDATTARLGGTSPLMVGDRLDTDIDGAIGAGIPSLVVLTGVSTLADLFAAERGRRPDFVAADLRGLGHRHDEVTIDGDTSRCGPATARVVGDVIEIEGAGPRDTSALRAAVQLSWSLRDGSGRATRDGSGRPTVPGGTLAP